MLVRLVECVCGVGWVESVRGEYRKHIPCLRGMHRRLGADEVQGRAGVVIGLLVRDGAENIG